MGGHLKDFVRQSNLQCGTLYDVFVDRFNHFSGDPGRGGNSPESEEQVQLEYQSENPLLNEAFRMIYNNLNRQKKVEPAAPLRTPPEFYPLLPLLEHSLKEPVQIKKKLVCRALLDVLYERYAFRTHLHNLRRIHLMRAGDLMEPFCLDLSRKKWRNETSLTLSLLNCISSRLPEASKLVSVSLIGDGSDVLDLTPIRINYAIPWPISLIINQDSLKKYNSVLRFLLEIKCALISLQRLLFKGLFIIIYPAGRALRFIP